MPTALVYVYSENPAETPRTLPSDRSFAEIPPVDTAARSRAAVRLDSLTKPRGSLGVLEDLAARVCAITSEARPSLSRKLVVVMAADHGVVSEGVSAYPQSVTQAMVGNFLSGGAAINVLARHVGSDLMVVDMGVAADLPRDERLVVRKVGYGTKNMAVGPAMGREEATRCVETGISLVEEYHARKGLDMVGTGDMGIGNTTSSSAIASVMMQEPPSRVTGRGTGIDEKMLENKVGVIERSLRANSPDRGDPLGVLSKVGGFEIGGLAGVILGGAKLRIPVVVDGFVSGAAALIACGLSPNARDYLIAGHASVEPGHRLILSHLGLEPVLGLRMRLGEGTGAALAFSIVEAGVKILNEMATFDEAGVERSIGPGG